MDIEYILNFLRELERNNNREWFMEHKDEYEKAKNDFDTFTSSLIELISTFEPGVKGMRPSQCTYRIYRDVRFSLDKSPYKNYMGAYINPYGKKSYHGGYYIHIQPGKCMLCVGSINWPPKLIKEVRQAVVDNIDEFLEIVEKPEFKKHFPTIGDSRLLTAPKGFDKNWEYIDYLKPKDYSVNCDVPETFFTEHTDTLLDRIDKVFKIAKPFADFINYTVDEFED